MDEISKKYLEMANKTKKRIRKNRKLGYPVDRERIIARNLQRMALIWIVANGEGCDAC